MEVAHIDHQTTTTTTTTTITTSGPGGTHTVQMPTSEAPQHHSNNTNNSSSTSYTPPVGLPPTQHSAPTQQLPTQHNNDNQFAPSREYTSAAVAEHNTNRQSLPNDANISHPRSTSRHGLRGDEPISATSATAPNFSYPTSRSSQQAPPTMSHPNTDSAPHMYGATAGSAPATRTDAPSHTYGATSSSVPTTNTALHSHGIAPESDMQPQRTDQTRSTMGSLKKAVLGVHVCYSFSAEHRHITDLHLNRARPKLYEVQSITQLTRILVAQTLRCLNVSVK